MSSLKSDERGAMMLIGLFFAIFGVAILYAAIGVSQATLFRQHIQDGADASALSGAVMQARSMNLIVLLNIVMAALLSVLVALKLVEAIAIAGIVVAGAVATPTYGGSLALIPPLETIRDKVKTIHDELEDPISEALEALHDLSELVADVAPPAAEAVAEGTRQAPVQEVFVSVGERLPVEDDEFQVLCAKAGRMPIDLAYETLPLPKSGVLKKYVASPLAGAMEKLSTTFSNWFCGDDSDSGGEGPPSESISDWFWYPEGEDGELCGEPPVAEGEELDRDVVEELTSAYADECSERITKAYTEGCGEVVCTMEDMYVPRAERARSACDPRESSFFLYKYQVREGTVPYTWDGERWVRGTPKFGSPEPVDEMQPPCGPMGQIDDGYNLTVHADTNSTVVSPVCSKEAAPFLPPGDPDSEVTVNVTEVTHILGCAKRETIPVNIDSDQAEGGEERSPQRVISGLEFGGNEFQLRSIAVGSLSTSSAEAAVRLSLWGHEEGETGLGSLRAFGGFGVAQAEFFYDEDVSSDAWMWNMKWRARITRFRASEEQIEPFYTSCQNLTESVANAVGAGGIVAQSDCTAFLDKLVELGPLVSH